MSKKILSVMLALMLVLSTFAVTAFAAESPTFEVPDEETEEIASTQTWALGEPTEVSDGEYEVAVSLTTNYVVGAISFRIDSANCAELTKVVINEEIITFGNNPAFNAEGKVAIVPEPNTEAELGAGVAEEGEEPGIDGVIATLTFKLVDGKDSATLTLVNDAKSATNPGGDLIAVRLSDENLSTATFIYGQRVLDADGADLSEGDEIASVTIGEASAPADLAKKAAAEAGILIDTAHTFGGAYKGVVFGFTQSANNTFMNTGYLTTNLEATNGGSLAFSRSIGQSGYGTGTVITVKNSDGSEAAKYVVVIFGDVDGNGLTNINDVKLALAAANVTTTLANNSVQRMACNCQNVQAAALMHTININDVGEVLKQTGATKIDQAALASRMASLTGTQYK